MFVIDEIVQAIITAIGCNIFGRFVEFFLSTETKSTEVVQCSRYDDDQIMLIVNAPNNGSYGSNPYNTTTDSVRIERMIVPNWISEQCIVRNGVIVDGLYEFQWRVRSGIIVLSPTGSKRVCPPAVVADDTRTVVNPELFNT